MKHTATVAKNKLQLEDVHKIAVFLNPATKNLELFPNEKDRIKGLVQTRMKRYQIPLPENPPLVGQVPPASSEISIDHLMTFVNHEDSPNEIEEYLKLSAPPRDFDLLKYWADMKHSLPGLKALADRIFSVQATSSASERLFSNAGFIVNDRRSGLAAKKIDDLLCLKWKRGNC